MPLAAVVLASLLISKGGAGGEPLIIVGVVVAYLATVGLDKAFGLDPEAQPQEAVTAPPVEPTPA